MIATPAPATEMDLRVVARLLVLAEDAFDDRLTFDDGAASTSRSTQDEIALAWAWTDLALAPEIFAEAATEVAHLATARQRIAMVASQFDLGELVVTAGTDAA